MNDLPANQELERLRRENAALDEQVKLLVRTEQRLYRSQGELDTQLAHIRALARFALARSSAESPDQVLERSLRFFDDLYQLEWSGFCWLEARAVTLAICHRTGTSTPRIVDPGADVRGWLSSLSVPVLVRAGAEGSTTPAPRLLRMLRDGTGVPLEEEAGTAIACLPIRGSGGERRGLLIGLARDRGRGRVRPDEMSERHLPFLQLLVGHVERALENATLTTHLRERSADLAASLEKLERTQQELLQAQKLDAVGRLAGGVAHDFNNLLTVILGHSSALRPALVSAAQVTHVDQIIEAGQRAASLTSQLLAMGRRQFQRREHLSLSELTERTVELLRRVIGEQITLTVECDPHLPEIHADRSQMEQVLLNLVLNARDAMPDGGRLTVCTRRAEARDAARCEIEVSPSAFAVLEVVDTGVGMDEGTRLRMFEPFFTTKPPGKGSGLGLSMVYGVVKQSEGHVLVESAPQRGTRLTVLLPLASIEARTDLPRPAPAPVACDATVLVVEDEGMIRNVVATTLRGAGYRVRVSENGEEARALVERESLPLDLLLTDVVMPKLGGVRLAETLRRRQPGLRVLFISGYSEDLVASGHVMGPDDVFLAKPFTSSVLLEHVARALSRAPRQSHSPR